jgi:hemoglobin
MTTTTTTTMAEATVARDPAEYAEAPRGTLFERLGGDPAVRAVMSRFYERIFADPELAPVFEGVNMRRHVAATSTFVGAATGGPRPWRGRDMASAHRHLAVTNEQFDRVAGHLVDTLDEMAVASELAGELLEIVGSLRSQIVLTRPVPNAYPR